MALKVAPLQWPKVGLAVQRSRPRGSLRWASTGSRTSSTMPPTADGLPGAAVRSDGAPRGMGARARDVWTLLPVLRAAQSALSQAVAAGAGLVHDLLVHEALHAAVPPVAGRSTGDRARGRISGLDGSMEHALVHAPGRRGGGGILGGRVRHPVLAPGRGVRPGQRPEECHRVPRSGRSDPCARVLHAVAIRVPGPAGRSGAVRVPFGLGVAAAGTLLVFEHRLVRVGTTRGWIRPSSR